jgi:hypothetical protein
MRKKHGKLTIIVAGGGEPMIFEPIPQRVPIDDARREWERRKFNYEHPYTYQHIGQRVMGEATRFRLDPSYMTDAGVNTTTENETYIVDSRVPGSVKAKPRR